MNENNLERFSELMLNLAENFSASLTDRGIAVRFDALKRYGMHQVERACERLLYHHKYTKMPTVADFVEAIEGSEELNAHAEALGVIKAIKQYGAGKSVRFKDGTTSAVVQHMYGGWPELCRLMRESEEKWFVRDFIKTYTAFRSRGVTFDSHHPGLIEGENVMKGFIEEIPEPVSIVGIYEEADQFNRDAARISGADQQITDETEWLKQVKKEIQE
jgi:hypothetical protein